MLGVYVGRSRVWPLIDFFFRSIWDQIVMETLYMCFVVSLPLPFFGNIYSKHAELVIKIQLLTIEVTNEE